ncbi:MAG TPA: hypothetical protein VNL71_24060 [Chloroflexota bacterium]|nr:hypothetical protein [Chloroflexota bacterium]
MHPISLRGGTVVQAGVYREMHSGRLVYLGTSSTLPGQSNSETYVKVPSAALFNHQPSHLHRQAKALTGAIVP